jgi:integrase
MITKLYFLRQQKGHQKMWILIMMLVNPYQIKMLKHDDGERLPIIIDRQTGFPIVPLNEHILYGRRTSVASNTLRKDLINLSYLFWWAGLNGIDIMQSIKSGEGFTSDEISMGLFPFLRQDFRFCGSNKIVDRNTIITRLETVKEFIIGQMRSIILKLSTSDPRIDRINKKIEILEKVFKSLHPAPNDAETREGLTVSETNLLLEITRPDHRNNPWKLKCRERNALIIDMLLSFGLRTGELLKIYVSECELNSALPGLRVQRKPDDVNDSRINEPNVKTESRLLPVIPEMAQKIDKYILNDRHKIPNSHKQKYLILSTNDGGPLGLRQVNKIFDEIKRKYPTQFGKLCPHILRHTAATFLRELAIEQNIDEERYKEHLKYFAGWRTDNSLRYTLLSIKQECHKLSLMHQKRLFSKKEDVSF